MSQNCRSEFELGEWVKYYDDLDDTWQEGWVEEVTPHVGSSAGDYKCCYKVRFGDGIKGTFSNCNPLLMCYMADEELFMSMVEPGINQDDMYWV
jgi:hypothetical protein